MRVIYSLAVGSTIIREYTFSVSVSLSLSVNIIRIRSSHSALTTWHTESRSGDLSRHPISVSSALVFARAVDDVMRAIAKGHQNVCDMLSDLYWSALLDIISIRS